MLYQVLFKKKPDVSCLEEFRTKCWVMIPNQPWSKLDPKAEEHVFVGIAEHAKAWKYLNTVSKHVQVSRNITFDSNDTRLFPIPDEDLDDTDLIALLEGESQLHEQATDPTPAIDVTTP